MTDFSWCVIDSHQLYRWSTELWIGHGTSAQRRHPSKFSLIFVLKKSLKKSIKKSTGCNGRLCRWLCCPKRQQSRRSSRFSRFSLPHEGLPNILNCFDYTSNQLMNEYERMKAAGAMAEKGESLQSIAETLEEMKLCIGTMGASLTSSCVPGIFFLISYYSCLLISSFFLEFQDRRCFICPTMKSNSVSVFTARLVFNESR